MIRKFRTVDIICSVRQLKDYVLHDRFWRSSFMMILFMLLGKGISFLWKIALAQAGPAALGVVQLSLVSLTLLANLCLLGLQTTIIRFITILRLKKQHRAAHAVLLFTFKISLSTALIVAAVVSLFPALAREVLQLHSLSDFSIRLLMGALPFFITSELLVSYFNATQQMVQYGLGKYVLQPLFRLLLLIGILFFPLTSQASIIIHLSLATLMSAVVLFGMSKLWCEPSAQWPSLSDRHRKEFLRYSLPVAGSFLLFIIYGSVDTFLLSRWMSIEHVGLYSALLLLVDLSDVAFLPSLNLLYAHLGSFEQNFSAGTRFVGEKIIVFALLSVLVFTTIGVVRQPLITFLLGNEYLSISSFVLPLLAAKLVETVLLFPLRHLLDFYGYVRLTLVFMTLTLLAKVSIGTYLTQIYGIGGLIFTIGLVNTLHALACFVALYVILRYQALRRSPTL